MVDTLGIYKRLKRARASESVSREIASIFGDVLESRLATKHDIGYLHQEMALMRSEFSAALANVSREFSGKLADTSREFSVNLADTSREFSGKLVEASREHSVNLATIARDMSVNAARVEKELKVEIAQSRVEILRWVLGMLVTQSALLLAAIKTL